MTLVRRARRGAIRLTITAALAIGALAVPTGASAAETFTGQTEYSLDGVVTDGCEEPVLLSGYLRETFHVTETSDGALTLVLVTTPVNLMGVGLETGTMYRAVGPTVQPTHASAWPDGTNVVRIWSGTLVDRTRLVGTAGAMTLDIRVTFHVTKLDNEPVVIFDFSSAGCR
jgi:hypothetical protein